MSSEPPDLDRLMQVPDPFGSDADALPAPAALPFTPSPTRARHLGRLLVAVALTLALQVVWIVRSRHAVALVELTPLRLAVGLGAPLGAALAVWRIATQRGSLGLGPSRAWLSGGIVAAPLLFALTTLAVAPADHDPSVAIFVGKAMPCLLSTAVLCGVALTLAAVAFRRAFAAGSVWRMTAVGTACGALAAATMSLACFHTEALHLLVGHGSMMLVGGVAGALLGRRFTRI